MLLPMCQDKAATTEDQNALLSQRSTSVCLVVPPVRCCFILALALSCMRTRQSGGHGQQGQQPGLRKGPPEEPLLEREQTTALAQTQLQFKNYLCQVPPSQSFCCSHPLWCFLFKALFWDQSTTIDDHPEIPGRKQSPILLSSGQIHIRRTTQV